jgi:hypothetical protein
LLINRLPADTSRIRISQQKTRVERPWKRLRNFCMRKAD